MIPQLARSCSNNSNKYLLFNLQLKLCLCLRQIYDNYFISQFQVGICLDQIPVAEAVLIGAEQELSVVLQIPVHIKVSHLHPACQLEPVGESVVRSNLQHTFPRNMLSIQSRRSPSYLKRYRTYFSQQDLRAPLCAAAQTLPRAGWWSWRWPALLRSWY